MDEHEQHVQLILDKLKEVGLVYVDCIKLKWNSLGIVSLEMSLHESL
jgi:hypothetical protein